MTTGRRGNPCVLNVARFVGTAAHELAVVVHRETEAERAAESSVFKIKHADDPPPMNLLAGGVAFDPSSAKQWFDYLTAPEVLDRCRHALGISAGELAKRIANELVPDNWQVFYWIGAWHNLLLEMTGEIVELEMQREEVLEDFERKKREFARAGAAERHAPDAKAKAFVIAEWQKYREDYKRNKTAFARDYVGRIKNEFERDVAHKTISTSWLKGQ